ncbi:hypothetical protein ACLOJK_004876 [Asimina triloba]
MVRSPEYHLPTPDYTWSNDVKSSMSLSTSPLHEVNIRINTWESFVSPITVLDVNVKFIEPFRHPTSSFSVWELRPLLSTFALLIDDVEAPDDLNVLLRLCSNLLTMGDHISVELEGMFEVMRLMIELHRVNLRCEGAGGVGEEPGGVVISLLCRCRVEDVNVAMEECTASLILIESHLLSTEDDLGQLEKAGA